MIDDGAVHALEATSLSRRFGAVLAVDDLDVRVERGGLTAILGPSGCGKSTALRLIAGLDRDGTGTVRINGRTVQSATTFEKPERRGVGLVFQDNVLFPHLDVAGNIGYGLHARERSAAVSKMVELLDIAGLEGRLPHELSGGQQQRVALARTLAVAPSIVLLDEPFSHLDAHLRERVRNDMVLALRTMESSALLVTHDQDEALAVADRVIVMSEGRAHQEGTPREIYHRPSDRFVAEFVGEATLVPLTVRGHRGGGLAARTPLGDLDLIADSVPEGAVGGRLAVVRPEGLGVVAGSDPRGSRGRVVRVIFHGRDAIAHVELESGMPVCVRYSGSAVVAPGDELGIVVLDPVWTVADRSAVSLGLTANGSPRVPSNSDRI